MQGHAGSCSVLQCVALSCSVLHCVAVCRRVLQSVAVPGRVLSVMQFGAMCCTVSVMQFVALCCTVFQSQDIPKVSSRHQKNTSERRSERGTEKGLCGGAGSEKKWVRDS